MDCSKHKGHKRYVGGPRDGEVDHLVFATPSDYPQTVGSHMIGRPTRSWYELDYDASTGVEAVYRFIGWGKEFPQRGLRGGGS